MEEGAPSTPTAQMDIETQHETSKEGDSTVQCNGDSEFISSNISILLNNREIDGAHLRTALPLLRQKRKHSFFHNPVDSVIRNNISFVSRLKVTGKLMQHEGCVNSVEWNEDGTKLITGSDDCRVVRSTLMVSC